MLVETRAVGKVKASVQHRQLVLLMKESVQDVCCTACSWGYAFDTILKTQPRTAIWASNICGVFCESPCVSPFVCQCLLYLAEMTKKGTKKF